MCSTAFNMCGEHDLYETHVLIGLYRYSPAEEIQSETEIVHAMIMALEKWIKFQNCYFLLQSVAGRQNI